MRMIKVNIMKSSQHPPVDYSAVLTHLIEQLEALKSFFPAEGRHCIRGDLPAEQDVDPEPWGELPYQAPRQCLVLAWLQQHAAEEGVRWAALDDWAEGFFAGEHRLLLVTGDRGVQTEHLEQLTRTLNLGV
jgi:hypothetical protein